MRSSVAFTVFVVLIFFSKNLTAQQVSSVTLGGTKFLLYTPPSYNHLVPTPLLVYLHGGGEIGDDLTLITHPFVAHHCPAWLIANTPALWPDNPSRPFIVLTPQLKRDPAVPNYNDQEWPTSLVDEAIEHVKGIRNINNSKIYLTGISLGAAGCWDYATANPAKVAGLVAFSGNTDVTDACLLKDMPIWVFHGERDGLVLSKESTEMVNAIKACAAPKAYTPQLNILFTEIHGGWNGVYEGTSGYLVFDWLLQFSKGNFTNKPPYVNTGPDRRMLIRETSITLSGEYFDTEGSVVQVQWSKLSGPALTLENTNKKFLRLKNLVAGIFEFQLTVTDNLGLQSSDKVILEIVNTVPTGEAAVSEIQLFKGNTDQFVLSLYDDIVINKNTLGTSEINLKAITNFVNGNNGSLRFIINGQQPNRGYDSYFIVPQGQIEWTATVGEYSVCVSPYKSPYKIGATGIWDCYKISVYDQPAVNYYLKPGADISNLNSWGINMNGTGTAPLSFTEHFQTFNIQTAGVLNSALVMDGVESSIWVKSGGSLTLGNQLSGLTINAEAGATINVNTNLPVTFGTLNSSSVVNFNAASTLIPSATYGNVSLAGTNTTKTLSTGTTVIVGNLTIADKVTLNGGTSSIVELGGNLNINETNSFSPTTPFSLKLNSTSQQSINFPSTRISIGEIAITGNKEVVLDGPASAVVELGSSSGGGLLISANNTLDAMETTLSIVGGGSLNGNGETGTIKISQGSIKLNSNTNKASNIYLVAGYDYVRMLSANLGGGGSLHVNTLINIVDSVKSYNGTIYSAGNIRLVSTGVTNASATIGRIEGTGHIDGNIQWERFIDGEKSFKYLSFPVTGVSVATLQDFLPITGNFTGSSVGYTTAPSLFQYDETAGGSWRPFPNSQNSETFQIGRGYSIYLRSTANIKFILSGGIQQGDFPFSLIPNPSAATNLGWNLLGNPYASAIRWGGSGWNTSGVSSAVYIRDNSYPGGRYFTWDSSGPGTGDTEFSGVIAPGQSFWTRVTNGTPGLTIHESAKHKAGSGTLFRTKETEGNSGLLTITLRKNELDDKAYVRLNPNANAEFEDQYDAVKMYNGFFNISTLTSDSVEVAINNTSSDFCNAKIPVSIATTESGDYTLSFSGSLVDQDIGTIYLVDSQKKDTVGIDESTLYTFSVAEDDVTKINHRFHIIEQTEVPIIELTNGKLLSNYKENNQWLLNGEEIKGETDTDFIPQVTGSYQVRVQNFNCTVISDPIIFIISAVTNKRSELRIYPNPASRHLFVEGLDNTPVQYSIVNALGIELQKGVLEPNHYVNEKQVGIDLDQYASGAYLLILFTKNRTVVHRFAIQPQ
jgi:predicted esterase